MSADAGLERWVAILAGGIGSRFWPASTPQRPKQFLPLATERPLIRDTLDRARALAPLSRVLIVAGSSLEPHVKKYLPELPAEQLLLEPQAKGTAPALAWAAKEIIARSQHPERTVMVSLHSDHVVRPLGGFVSSLGRAVDAAAEFDRLLTVGIAPTRPETGYGYIEVGDSLAAGVFEVRRFVEKPDLTTAESYIARGGFVWNSGMFVWRPQVLLGELASHTPELAAELGRLDTGDSAGFFANTPTLTIDHGLMERTANIAVVAADFEWDDVGAWAALGRIRESDAQGNLIVGEAHALDCNDCLVWAEDGPVALFGLSDVVVVRASGITLVSSRDHASDLKRLLATLPDDLRKGIEPP